MEFVPQEIAPVEESAEADPKKTPATLAHYRIPAICTVKLTEGVDILLQTRMPVYQLGIESTVPVNVILK